MAERLGMCLGCSEIQPELFLDLGLTPLANSYPAVEDLSSPEPRFRLAVAYCPRCNLVQLTDTVPPGDIYGEYLYFSSYSESFLRHAAEMARTLKDRFGLGPDSFVVEIASNDGYLLKNFVSSGIPVLGVEPAANIARVAEAGGVPTLVDFFGEDSARRIRDERGAADVIIGNNVLAHAPRINDFLSGVNVCLKDEGIAVFEVPWLHELIRKVEFDTIYHEHVFYYSLAAIEVLLSRAGLSVFDVERQAVHGGSLRLYVCKKGRRVTSPAAREIRELELQAGLTNPDTYRKFSHEVNAIREKLTTLLRSLKSDGRSIAAYGAAAKGSTLLNYCGIDAGTIDFVADRNSYKQGRLMPGVHVPIVSPEEIRIRRPDYILILPWNLREEIIAQISFIREWGGRFIVPIPSPEVL